MTPADKKYLRGLCHHIKPVVRVADKGLTQSVVAEIDCALQHHELIKVRLRVPRHQRQEFGRQILNTSHAEKVHEIGQILCLYRRNHDDPKIFPGKHGTDATSR